MKFASNSPGKGQVTIFVILGIVILVIVVFGLIISSSLSKLKIQSDASKAVDAYLQSDAVNYYVYTCMDSSVTSSIYDLAIQGGVFYDYQNGSYMALAEGVTHVPYNITWVDSSGINYSEINISYSILNNSYCSMVETQVPYYPYNRTFVRDLFWLYNDYTKNENCLYDAKEGYRLSGFAGFNNMTRLCTIGSNNTKSVKSAGASVEFSPCYESVIMAPNKSIEHILAEQISLRMANCTDFSVFKDDNITVSGMPETRIIYTSESVLVEITYNLTVKIKNKEPVIVKHTFSYKSNLRLAKLHNYVMSLVKAESQDFFFNINNNYENYGIHNELNPEKFYDKDYMGIQVVNFTNCTDCPYQFDHLLIVEDRKSMVGNRPLTYMTMIKNRIPALDFIHLTSPSSFYDVVVSNNQEIVLEPQGYDPDDENNITYMYEGWKETFDEVCHFPAPQLGVPLSPSDANCQVIQNVIPNNWTTSKMFVDSKRRANYTTNLTDMGPHNVTITARDISGLEDYQVVNILVFDLPKALQSPIKPYIDIDENITSIEDNFTLDGSGSTASTILSGHMTGYIWTINTITPPETVFINKTTESRLIVPTEYYDATMTPDLLIQKIKLLNLSNVGIHNVSLVAESYLDQYGVYVQSLPDYMILNVEQCLPHENNLEYPFPYNTPGTDPFLANHSCCNAGFIVRSSGDNYACYIKEQYGEINLLKNTNTVQSNNAKFDLNSYQPSDNLEDTSNFNLLTQRNDIYKMTFERFCDGSRGNICAGDMKRTIVLATPCADKNTAIGEDETCQGPSSTSLTDSDEGCMLYAPGTSFETIFGSGADGICNTQPRCSDLGFEGYNTGGVMRCQATCGGGSCTNTRISECSCNVLSCHAQCDATPTHTSLRTATACRSACDLTDSCTFQHTDLLPCGLGLSYCFGTTGNFVNYCYYNVGCDASGGKYTKRDDSYCVPGKYVTPGNPDVCIFGADLSLPNRCASDGNCNLQKRDNTTINCLPTQTKVCSTTSGWICQ